MIELDWANEPWFALAERALFRPQTNTLFIADPHFGKDESFRVSGVGLPTGTLTADLERLGEAVSKSLADKLIILGDFFHDRDGKSEAVNLELEDWFRRHKELDVILIRGNHDARSGDPIPQLNIRCENDPCLISGILCAHIPPEAAIRPTLAGHIHPCVRLGAGTFQKKYACFHFSEMLAILPAFGSFTGNASLPIERGNQIIIVDGNRIAKIT